MFNPLNWLKTDDDLICKGFPALPENKDGTDYEVFITDFYDYVITQAENAVKWYYKKRLWKGRLGRGLRYLAILSTTAAGVIPIYGSINEDMFGIPNLDPGWSAMAVALAGLAIAIDKFGGFTSGWVRFIQAAQKIDDDLEVFKVEWQRERLKVQSTLDVHAMLRLMTVGETFMAERRETVHQETAKWVSDFQAVLNETEANAKALRNKKKLTESGALSVEVSNGDECEGDWTLYINGIKQHSCTGKRITVGKQASGLIEIEVKGMIKGNGNSVLLRDSLPVKISGGEITTVQLTLS
ncbi:MAG: hypothetical protein ACI9FJ_001808 [Alteromonadaceae bacterium]|jgi:hypothetical protein